MLTLAAVGVVVVSSQNTEEFETLHAPMHADARKTTSALQRCAHTQCVRDMRTRSAHACMQPRVRTRTHARTTSVDPPRAWETTSTKSGGILLGVTGSHPAATAVIRFGLWHSEAALKMTSSFLNAIVAARAWEGVLEQYQYCNIAIIIAYLRVLQYCNILSQATRMCTGKGYQVQRWPVVHTRHLLVQMTIIINFRTYVINNSQ